MFNFPRDTHPSTDTCPSFWWYLGSACFLEGVESNHRQIIKYSWGCLRCSHPAGPDSLKMTQNTLHPEGELRKSIPHSFFWDIQKILCKEVLFFKNITSFCVREYIFHSKKHKSNCNYLDNDQHVFFLNMSHKLCSKWINHVVFWLVYLRCSTF